MAKAPRYEGLTPQTQPADALRAILGVLYAAMLREAPAVLHEQDVRATHDMRVALRRLRSALETFAAEFARADLRARERALRRLARRLGDVRDADVHLAELRAAFGGATASESPGIAYAIEALVARRRTALARFAIELSQFDREAIVGDPADMAAGSRKPLRKFVRHAVRTRLRKVLQRASSAIPEGGDAALHALRKEVKRLRYTLEFFGDLLGPDGAEALGSTERVQDRLGTIADAVAFARTYAELLDGLDRADPRRAGREACRDAARTRREKALAGLRKLWGGDGAYPGKLAASISSALGSLSPKSPANGPAGAISKRGR